MVNIDVGEEKGTKEHNPSCWYGNFWAIGYTKNATKRFLSRHWSDAHILGVESILCWSALGQKLRLCRETPLGCCMEMIIFNRFLLFQALASSSSAC